MSVDPDLLFYRFSEKNCLKAEGGWPSRLRTPARKCTDEDIADGKERRDDCMKSIARAACTVAPYGDILQQRDRMNSYAPSLHGACNIGNFTDNIYCTEPFIIDDLEECKHPGVSNPGSTFWGARPMHDGMSAALSAAQRFTREVQEGDYESQIKQEFACIKDVEDRLANGWWYTS